VDDGRKDIGYTVDDEAHTAPAAPARTLWQDVRTREFGAMVAFVVLLVSDLQFYVATVRAQTVLLGDSAAYGYAYTKAYNIISAAGFVAFPLVSYMLERRGFAATFAMVATLIALYNATALVPVLAMQYLTFLLWSTGRFALFSAYFAYLPEAFGFRHFGTLNGILSVFMALGAVLPYPLTLLVLRGLGGQYWPINVAFFVVVSVAGVVYPAWLLRRRRQRPSGGVS